MGIKDYLKKWFYLKIKKMTIYDYNVFLMREKGISVGTGCHICQMIATSEPGLITIGNNVTTSSNVVFCTHDNAISKCHESYTDLVGKVIIGDNCFIGMNTIIMLGVTIGNNCIIGAGSVVTKSIPSGYVVAGNPARIVCTTAEYYEKNKEKAFCFRNMTYREMNKEMVSHQEKYIEKKDYC